MYYRRAVHSHPLSNTILACLAPIEYQYPQSMVFAASPISKQLEKCITEGLTVATPLLIQFLLALFQLSTSILKAQAFVAEFFHDFKLVQASHI